MHGVAVCVECFILQGVCFLALLEGPLEDTV
jgi:hypothetical protein